MTTREEKAINKYLKNIARQLICSRATKQALLDGMRQELIDCMSELPKKDYAQLISSYGAIESVAKSLQENVSEEEYEMARRKRKRIIVTIVIGVAIVVLALSVLVYYLTINTQVTVTETVEAISEW